MLDKWRSSLWACCPRSVSAGHDWEAVRSAGGRFWQGDSSCCCCMWLAGWLHEAQSCLPLHWRGSCAAGCVPWQVSNKLFADPASSLKAVQQLQAAAAAAVGGKGGQLGARQADEGTLMDTGAVQVGTARGAGFTAGKRWRLVSAHW